MDGMESARWDVPAVLSARLCAADFGPDFGQKAAKAGAVGPQEGHRMILPEPLVRGEQAPALGPFQVDDEDGGLPSVRGDELAVADSALGPSEAGVVVHFGPDKGAEGTAVAV